MMQQEREESIPLLSTERPDMDNSETRTANKVSIYAANRKNIHPA